MKVIEVLFPLFSNIYADSYNINYLKKCNKNIKIVYTNYGEEPYFMGHKVDMIYIGSMPDSKILVAIDHLKPYKDKLMEMIENNVLFLVTGNALEIFSSYINENNKKEEGLNLFDYYIEKDLTKKNASWYFGDFNNIKIVGHRNQCSKCFNIKHNFINTNGGLGSDLALKSNEGIKYKNFYATYLLGPILIMNPKFTKHILGLLNLEKKLIYEKEITLAYKKRLEYFENPNARFVMEDHG